METQTSRQRISLPVICPDYDSDCGDMSYDHALQCYKGFPNNQHLMEGGLGPEGMGLACGQCPILIELN